MALEWKPIRYAGSFQQGQLFRSENPRAEVWKHLARLGTIEEVTRVVKSMRFPKDRAALVSARIRQAIEFRSASREASLLTSPLLLFYSFQNLSRALIGITQKEEPPGSHGIEFHPMSRDILDCVAEFGSRGTLPALITFLGGSVTPGTRLSLRQVIACIPELLDISNIDKLKPNYVTVIRVNAYLSNESSAKLVIRLPEISPKEFRSRWKEILPSLKGLVNPSVEDFCLEFIENPGRSYLEISRFLEDNLWSDLRFRQDPVWYYLRSDNEITKLPRAAYYFVAIFLLSNVVRYEPSLIAELNPDVSELGWALREVMDVSDRYFPQLMLNLILQSPTYFT